MSEKRRTSFLIVLGILAAGLALSAVAVWLLAAEIRFGRDAERVTGIVDLSKEEVSQTGRRGRPGSVPVYYYSGTQPIDTRVGTFFWVKYDNGQELPLLCDPTDPDKVRLDHFWLRYWLPLLLLPLGLVGVVVGFRDLWRRHREARRRKEPAHISPAMWRMR
jgi:hypothetical protein